MQILLLLSEEVFDYGKNQMTQTKVTRLKSQLNQDFEQIFDLCSFVLTSSQNQALLATTLRALLRFLRWIPLEFILKTQLIPTLALRFFPDPLYRNLTVQCLNEIACLEYASKFGPQFDGLYTSMLTAVLENVYGKLATENVDLNQLFSQSNQKMRQFFIFLTNFLTNFVSKHLSILENNPQSHQILISALALIIRLTLIEEEPSIFVTCLEFWNGFLKDVYRTEQSSLQKTGLSLGFTPSSTYGAGFNQTLLLNNNTQFVRIAFYQTTFSNLTQVMLVRMVKPEEVLIVVDEMGNADRVRLDTTETTSNYNLMRETFAFLTFLDSKRIMDCMCEQTQEVLRTVNTEFKPHMLNRLCWAIGSIARALTETQEKKLLAAILRALLALVDLRPKKDDKAIVAANIMHVVGQYPRFLRLNYSFLITVIDKLFQFMHERHPGVQDMAVDTFLTIATKCKRCLVVAPSPDEQLSARHGTPAGQVPQAYIYTILNSIYESSCDLEKTHLYTYYEAVASIISAESDPTTRDQMLFSLMKIPNEEWVAIVQQANQGNVDILKEINTIRRLDMTLKINTRVAGAVTSGAAGSATTLPVSQRPGGYCVQISRLFLEMLVLYRMYSSYVSDQIKQQGENVTRVEVIRLMIGVKKEMLVLCNTFVATASPQELVIVQQRFLPELINTIIQDYVSVHPSARDPEVLALFTTLIQTLKKNLPGDIIMKCFINLFPSTLNMITANFEDNPEHRRNLYHFLQVVVEHHLPVLFTLQPNEFQLVMDSLYWGIKHLTRDIQEYSLLTLESILLQLQQYTHPVEHPNQFYQSFVFPSLQGILGVLTDTFHRSSFNRHTSILALIFNSLQNNKITVLLTPPTPAGTDPSAVQAFVQQHQKQSGGNIQVANINIVKHYLSQQLLGGFSTVNSQQVNTFLDALFDHCNDATKFRNFVTNFLIELKEFAAHVDELEQQLQQPGQQQAQNQ
jgi:exportin-1